MAINFLNNAAFAGTITVQGTGDSSFVGNVGIGTTSPNSKLEVNDSSTNLQMRVGSLTAGISPIIRLQGKNTANTTNHYADISLDAENGKLIFNDPGTSSGSIGQNPMVLDSDGNVGIGTASPDSLLNLEGAKNTSIITLGSTTNNSSWSVGDRVGGIDFYSGDGSGSGSGIKASISYEVEAGATGSTNSMVFRASGTTSGTKNLERMRITSGGDVGIGTDSPDAKLHVVGKQMITAGANASPQTEDYLFIGGDGLASANASIYIGNRGDGTGYGWRMFYEGVGSGVNNKLKFKSENLGSPIDVITMTQDGNVGIGTASPGAKLDVEGDDAKIRINNTTGTIADLTILDLTGLVLGSGAGNERSILLGQGGNASRQAKISYSQGGSNGQLPSLSFFTGDSVDSLDERMRITSGGDVNIRGTNTKLGWERTSDGASNIAYLTKTQTISTNGEAKLHGYDGIIFTSAGAETERMRITSGGNVGIGTTSPESNLEISDSTQATGATLSITNAHIGSWVTGDKIGSIDFRIDDTSTTEPVRAKIHTEGKTTGTYPYSSQLVFSTANANTLSEGMRIDSDGNVGIGTDNPVPALHVYQNNTKGGTAAGLTIEQEGTGDAVLSFLLTGTERWKMGIDNSDSDKFKISKATNLSSNNALTIDANSNVGIGTTSPISVLEISKQLSAASTIDYPYTISSRDDGGLINQLGGEGVGIKFRIAGNDATTPGNSLVGASIAAIKEGSSDTNSSAGLGFFVSQDDETLDEAVRIDHDGNVGINDTTPSYKLDVNGEGRFIGDLRCLSLIQTSQSDKKEFIQDIVKTTNKKIEFKEYVYKSDSGNRKRYGVLAEDIEVDYPELVHIDADGVKGVNYIDLLVKRVAEIERELENVYLTAQVDSSIQLADDLAAPSASKDNDGDYFDAIGSDAAHGNTLSGKTIFSNQSLPSYTNRASATTAITVANGASAGDTYLYYNSSNFQIEGVRL